MSIIVKGVKMPEDCPVCPLAHWNKLDRFTGCEIKKRYFDKADMETRGRPDFCPLVELPPHGRLIDADELVADIKGQAERLWTLDSVSERDYFIERNEKFRQAMFKAWCESLFAYLDTRPTVIEREVAE